MSGPRYPRVASFKTSDAFRQHLAALGIDLPLDETVEHGPDAPLAQPVEADGLRAGNRFAILPMEGWDGTTDGRPSPLTERRWRRFGESGAKLIWGGEAVAVRHDGRANPNQLLINDKTVGCLEALRRTVLAAHRTSTGSADDVVIGLQLTHSGRYARPDASGPRPRIAYRHPLLDRRVKVTSNAACFSDEEMDRLVDVFVEAARLAAHAGYDFVDIKHCHGYLGHELLSARTRPGRYGGSLENRTRFLRDIAGGIRATAPGLRIGVRLSAFDMIPFRGSASEQGEPEPGAAEYTSAFGLTPPGASAVLDDADELLGVFEQLGIVWVCITAGSPYYNPHIQRPAIFPPSDGYTPPEDPLAGVARQIRAAADLKARHPRLAFVGSGYSYLQEWLPHVAQAAVRGGMVDAIGLGRMALSYPELPADVLAGRPVQRQRLCRTFSDCTTAPRNGLVSGCYPLDPFYAAQEQAITLKELKRER